MDHSLASHRLIYRSQHFTVEAPEKPLIDRQDGGHIVINPIEPVADRQMLTPYQAIDLMRLTIVAGHAMREVMRSHGIDIGRINYQDNGNWSVFAPGGPTLHIHLYGRAIHARIQRYGEATYFPHRDREPEFYSRLEPLTQADIRAMGHEIQKWMDAPSFSDEHWGLSSASSFPIFKY